MKNRNNIRGATLVEFALILPVFLFLVFAILNFGRALQIYQTLTNAAREGARYSAAPYEGTNPGDLPETLDVEAKVCAYLLSGNLPCGSKSTVSISQAGTKTVNGITMAYTQVDVSAPYTFIGLPLPDVTMTTHAVMRNENDGTP